MDTTTGNATHLTAANPAVLRVQSRGAFGAARLELWSDPPGTASEWRPAYIESFDNGGFTGGLRIVTNGTGQANRQASAEQLRIVNGAVGIGVTDPGFRLDVGGRSRFRDGGGGNTAGFWLHNPAAAAPKDRAFIGLANDNMVGLYGNTGAGWGLQMNTTTGNVTVGGRCYDNKYRNEIWVAGQVLNNNALPYRIIPGMSVTFSIPNNRYIWVWAHLPGVQVTGGDGAHSAAYFNMTLDGGEIAFTRQEFHNNGWELRDVTLTRLFVLGAGSHTIAINWAVGAGGGQVGCCWYGDARKLMVVEL
jgi:hypothetical protein